MSKLGGGLILKALELIEKNKANFIEQNGLLQPTQKKFKRLRLK